MIITFLTNVRIIQYVNTRMFLNAIAHVTNAIFYQFNQQCYSGHKLRTL